MSKLAQNPIFKFFSSLKLTVTCLGLLFILTWCGTIFQIDQGLYLAQKQIFHSFWFLMFGFLPFPGAQLVLWIFFLNLVCVTLTRFIHYRFKKIGILIIHFGILTYFVGAFVTLTITKETFLQLLEGEGANVSTFYNEWELSIWQSTQSSKNVTAIDAYTFHPKTAYRIDENFSIEVKSYYSNSKAFTITQSPEHFDYVNASGIQSLVKVANIKEPEKNMPSGQFIIHPNGGQDIPVLLYGGEAKPTTLSIANNSYNFQLRRKRHVLPFVVTLKNFTREMHPGTEIPRTFKSLITVTSDAGTREVLISMNKPFRYKDYTFYQASYSIDTLGREYSTLAVVKNAGRLLPYISCFVTLAGLLVHFLGRILSLRKNK